MVEAPICKVFEKMHSFIILCKIQSKKTFRPYQTSTLYRMPITNELLELSLRDVFNLLTPSGYFTFHQV